jgi:soluble lytic murein transglycosylase
VKGFFLHTPLRGWGLFGAVLLCGCRSDVPAVALPNDGTSAQEESKPDAAEDEEPAGPPRELWFATGPGRAAIIARERRDFDAARTALDELLADDDLSQDDRAAAQWLRGLEDLRAEAYAAAADRFAEAAKAPALAPVRARLRALEAQARLDAGDPNRALAVLRDTPDGERKSSPLQGDFAIMEADALLRTNDEDGARKRYAAYVREHPKGRRTFEAKAKLARLLARSEKKEDLAEAVDLYEGLLLEQPLSDFGDEARKELPALSKRAGKARTGKAAREFEQRVEVGVIEANLDRRRYKTAITEADALLRTSKLDTEGKCRVLFAKASAIFKQRNRAGSRPVFEKAAAACHADKALLDYEVKARYQGARGLYAEAKHSRAAAVFEALGKELPKHSYADDAWVLAGESWAEAGDEKKAGAAYDKALATGGDMADEARRRLLLQAFAAKDFAGALKLCDAKVADGAGDPAAKAKLHYFRGRALAELGKKDEAIAAWRAAVAADPLGYGSLLAMSRLRDAGQEAFTGALEYLQAAREGEELPAPGKGAERALILARLGLGEEASQELAHAEIDGWPAVAVLDQAGLYSEAQVLIANLGSKWRTSPPVGAHRRRWELAHPRPFIDLIRGYEKDHGVPSLLTYAVMKTESRYDPGATSWAGARGLIQLMPGTAKTVAKSAGVELAEDSLYDPATNLDLGMRYLAGLVGRYDGGDAAVVLAVPSYNAGAGAVDKWLAERGSWELDLFVEAIPYDETRHYTQSVLGRWWAYRWLYGGEEPQSRVPVLPRATPGRAGAARSG